MALTKTKLSGTITAGQTQFTLAAFTNPSTGGVGPVTLLAFATGEKCLVTDATYSPTVSVVRGYAGTVAAAHIVGEGISYGLSNDAAWASYIPDNYALNMGSAAQVWGAAEMTATGTTGSDAAPVVVAWPAFINSTGASDAGIILPYPQPGAVYNVHNDSTTGAVKVYAVLGATINGASGATGNSITATGDKGAIFNCSTAGAWKMSPAAT